MQLLLDHSGSRVSVTEVQDQLEAGVDDPPSRKIVYDCFNAMERLGLVEAEDAKNQDPTTSKTVHLAPSYQRQKAA